MCSLTSFSLVSNYFVNRFKKEISLQAAPILKSCNSNIVANDDTTTLELRDNEVQNLIGATGRICVIIPWLSMAITLV